MEYTEHVAFPSSIRDDGRSFIEKGKNENI